MHEATDLEKTPLKTSFAADSLAIGLVVMLAMTIVQRGVGFFRGIWFCRLLDDHLVGQWAMAFGFVTMITPIMLLGMPGSLPRYVEHFRLRGQLPQLVRRLLGGTIGCACDLLCRDDVGTQVVWLADLLGAAKRDVDLQCRRCRGVDCGVLFRL